MDQRIMQRMSASFHGMSCGLVHATLSDVAYTSQHANRQFKLAISLLFVSVYINLMRLLNDSIHCESLSA